MNPWTFPRLWASLLSIGSLVVLPGIALSQTDYSAGKSPPQLFASDCSACHRSPQGLASGRDAGALTAFLREHYTTHVEWAGALANYLIGVGGAPPRQRATAPAAQSAPATNTATAQPPRPPGNVQGGQEDAAAAPDSEVKPPVVAVARERAKPGDVRGPKGKITPEPERDSAKTDGDALQKKIRAYATVGEEALSPSGSPVDAVAPALRPSSDALQSATPAPAPEARPQGGTASGDRSTAPAAPSPANTPAPPVNERPRASPPG